MSFKPNTVLSFEGEIFNTPIFYLQFTIYRLVHSKSIEVSEEFRMQVAGISYILFHLAKELFIHLLDRTVGLP